MALPINLPKRENIQGFWKLEETSGTRYDETKNNNHLTDNNTVGYGTGKIGNAADFEFNNSEFLSIAHASQTGLDITGSMTILCWIKIESIPSYMSVIGKLNDGVGKIGYRLDITKIAAGKLVRAVLSSNGSSTVVASSSTALNTGTWYHIGFTFNRTTGKIQVYINGSANGSGANFTSNIYHTDANFSIGATYNNSLPYTLFDGLIDEAIVWNTALTADEVADVYNITEYEYKKASAGILNWWFIKDSWEKHDKIWKPKILKPEFEI